MSPFQMVVKWNVGVSTWAARVSRCFRAPPAGGRYLWMASPLHMSLFLRSTFAERMPTSAGGGLPPK